MTVSPIECYVLVGISQRIEKNLWNCATITDGNTEELVPVSISQRVENNLRKCTIITDGNTDGLVPVGISQRVKKNLRNCATITDGYTDGFTDDWRTSRSARMSKVWSVGMFISGFVGMFTDGTVIGTFTDGLKSLADF